MFAPGKKMSSPPSSSSQGKHSSPASGSAKATSQQHQIYLDSHGPSSSVQMPSSFFLTSDSDPRSCASYYPSEPSPPSYRSSRKRYSSPPKPSRSLAHQAQDLSASADPADNVDNGVMSPTDPHLNLSSSIISTDDDAELSSSSSSTYSLPDALNYNPNYINRNLDRDCSYNALPSEAGLFRGRLTINTPIDNPSPMLSITASSIFTDKSNYDSSLNDETFEYLNNYNNYNFDRDQSHLPSNSISNSAAFSRALKQAPLDSPSSPTPLDSSEFMSQKHSSQPFPTIYSKSLRPVVTPAAASSLKDNDNDDTKSASTAMPNHSFIPKTPTVPPINYLHIPKSQDKSSGNLPSFKPNMEKGKFPTNRASRPKMFASPKLVMPKVSLPTLRPFTTDGLALGKLKILVAGDSGTGKSMLIKAIAQTSKDIVYISDAPTTVPLVNQSDSISSVSNSYQQSAASQSLYKQTQAQPTLIRLPSSSNASFDPTSSCIQSHATTTPSNTGNTGITGASSFDTMTKQSKSLKNDKTSEVLWEYAASTRPHLDFSSSSSDSDLGDSDSSDRGYGDYYDTGVSHYSKGKSLDSKNKQRKSSTTTRRPSVVQSATIRSDVSALEKNVCFVDTLGYGSFADASRCINRVITYLESAFQKTSTLINPNNPEASGLLTSSSSMEAVPMVNVCLYTITARLKPVDIEYISKLSKYTPVVPVIARSDLLPLKEVLALKLDVLQDLKMANISPFLFENSLDDAIQMAKENVAKFTEANSRRNSSISSVRTVRPMFSGADKIASNLECAIEEEEAPINQSYKLPSSDYEPLVKSYYRNAGTMVESSMVDVGDCSDALDSDVSSLDPLDDGNGEHLQSEFKISSSKLTDPSSNKSTVKSVSEEDNTIPFLFPCAVSSISIEESESSMFSSIGAGTVLITSEPSFIPSSSYNSGTDESTLVPSELDDLCKHLFSFHGATWLRHASAKKFLSWAQKQEEDQTFQQVYQSDYGPIQPITNSDDINNEDDGSIRTIVIRDTRSQVGHLKPNLRGWIYASAPPANFNQPSNSNTSYAFIDDKDFEKIMGFDVAIDIEDVDMENRRKAQRSTSKWVMDVAQADGAICYAVPVVEKPSKSSDNQRPMKRPKKQYNGYKGRATATRQEWQLIPIFTLVTPRPIRQHLEDDGDGSGEESKNGSRYTRYSNTTSGTNRRQHRHGHGSKRSIHYSSRGIPDAPISKHSSSIIDVDPMNVLGVSLEMWNLAFKAIGVAIGIRLIFEFIDEIFSATSDSVTSSQSILRSVVVKPITSTILQTINTAGTTFDNLINALLGPIGKIVATISSPFMAPADVMTVHDQFIQFGDSSESVRPQSLLSALFSGELQDNVFVVLLNSLGSGLSRMI